VQTIPPGDDKIVPLRLSEPAPFAGQLFDNDTALRWANWLKQYKLRLTLDTKTIEDTCAVRARALNDSLMIERQHYDEMNRTYEQKVQDLQYEVDHPPWYKSLGFGIGVGVAATLIAVGITVSLLK
jgi:hypothetical protein